MGADDSYVVYPYDVRAHGGSRFIRTFRPIHATWPFIVIYTIINDTNQIEGGAS